MDSVRWSWPELPIILVVAWPLIAAGVIGQLVRGVRFRVAEASQAPRTAGVIQAALAIMIVSLLAIIGGFVAYWNGVDQVFGVVTLVGTERYPWEVLLGLGTAGSLTATLVAMVAWPRPEAYSLRRWGGFWWFAVMAASAFLLVAPLLLLPGPSGP